ncbi:MAG: hypothetical protein K0S68_493 [Candidatus Saccharibacteria bacterium]|jgi:hypothetical protein|nr:hypothetical protein [Candidatus Saccharibacteria bacterium]
MNPVLSKLVDTVWYQPSDPWWVIVLKTLIIGGFLALIFLKGMNKVKFGHRGVRTRGEVIITYKKDQMVKRGGEWFQVYAGEAKEYRPLIYPAIPFAHNMHCESVQVRFLELPPIVRPEPLQDLSIQLFFQLVNLDKAIVKNLDFKGALVSNCAAAVTRALNAGDYDDLSASLLGAKLSEVVLADEEFKTEATALGARLIRLNVASANTTPAAQLAKSLKKEGALLDPALAAILLERLSATATVQAEDAPQLSVWARLRRRFAQTA